jgi:hypothetical protein
MPNMLDDGFLDQAQFMTSVSNQPVSLDAQLQNAVATAIGGQAILGAGTAHTITVSVAAYTAVNAGDGTIRNDLIQRIMQRLTNLGYTSSLTGTTLTITWP